MVPIATRLMLGASLSEFGLARREVPYFGVKEAVFPFNMFPEVDVLLGPEMRSTGEVLGIGSTFGLAFFKAQEAAGQELPLKGSVLLTVADRDKHSALEVARRLADMGFTIKATRGTQDFLKSKGIDSEPVNKRYEARPDIVDEIKSNMIDLVINTPSGKTGKFDDSYIRKAAIKHKIPYITTLSAAVSAAKGIEDCRVKKWGVQSLQDYHKALGSK
jgi:carbamoyl-phosphate synthase large subunit